MAQRTMQCNDQKTIIPRKVSQKQKPPQHCYIANMKTNEMSTVLINDTLPFTSFILGCAPDECLGGTPSTTVDLGGRDDVEVITPPAELVSTTVNSSAGKAIVGSVGGYDVVVREGLPCLLLMRGTYVLGARPVETSWPSVGVAVALN